MIKSQRALFWLNEMLSGVFGNFSGTLGKFSGAFGKFYGA
jgi:hypothetical protein